ncbi:helix-hairpin-helix domain-containing protein [Leuconostoc holzapfelii]|uniref:Transporter n=1 Tax=Leuconostoc holzapfelii TaxID=434464 RepID=A0A846ZAV2_9LACO|nr:helix-hairpin-helix domain-containing protein [Leuconostoc holzapfelii]NKZ17888.1 transporter [Leuconostoc holzapfelii]
MIEQFEQFKSTWLAHRRWLVVGLLVAGVCLLFFAVTRQPTKTIPQPQQSASQASQPKQAQNTRATNDKILIDIKGAVKRPGVYEVSQQPRLQAVIAQAGGLTEQADSLQINLAQKLTDGQMIYVPEKGETGPVTGAGGQNQSANQAKVNLNTATVDELQMLEGIGEKKAEQIIAYRQTNGGFKQITDLKAVSGIGEKRFETLKDKLTV